MDWTMFLAFAGLNVAIFAGMAALVVWSINKLDNDIKGLSARIDGICGRVDSLNSRLDGHARRIDQLYVMFVDLLKERK